MNEGQLNSFKEKLYTVRQNLLAEVDKVNKHSNDEFESDVPDLNDEASRTYNRQVKLSIGEVERNQLKLVDEALDAIESGDYGTCIDCEEVIPIKRLETVPYAKRCVECKTKYEEELKSES